MKLKCHLCRSRVSCSGNLLGNGDRMSFPVDGQIEDYFIITPPPPPPQHHPSVMGAVQSINQS